MHYISMSDNFTYSHNMHIQLLITFYASNSMTATTQNEQQNNLRESFRC